MSGEWLIANSFSAPSIHRKRKKQETRQTSRQQIGKDLTDDVEIGIVCQLNPDDRHMPEVVRIGADR